MPLESVICRRKLDEARGNPQICECWKCREQGQGTDKGLGEIVDPVRSWSDVGRKEGGKTGL